MDSDPEDFHEPETRAGQPTSEGALERRYNKPLDHVHAWWQQEAGTLTSEDPGRLERAHGGVHQWPRPVSTHVADREDWRFRIEQAGIRRRQRDYLVVPSPIYDYIGPNLLFEPDRRAEWYRFRPATYYEPEPLTHWDPVPLRFGVPPSPVRDGVRPPTPVRSPSPVFYESPEESAESEEPDSEWEPSDSEGVARAGGVVEREPSREQAQVVNRELQAENRELKRRRDYSLFADSSDSSDDEETYVITARKPRKSAEEDEV